jgi:crotonobetainyl-CoA:carnitine CoA-transferase CaiB-like acyl-CoA transferase
MLLADHGAHVTRIEPPSGDPFKALSGSQVWGRGKKSMRLDLKSDRGRERFLALVDQADVVIESFSPGVSERLGIDHRTLLARNPHLVHCSITGYGESGKDARRPGYDALVAARTGQLYEGRGVPGTTLALLSGSEGIMPGLEVPDGCFVGAPRPGPLFSGVPWPSLGAFYLAVLGISAALRARELTGRGQHVHTSLLQGVLATTAGSWQRVERPDTPSFLTWIPDPRAPKGFFKGSDGEWTHHWVPLPAFVLEAADGDVLASSERLSGPRRSGMRISTDPEDMVILQAMYEPMAAAVAKFPAEDWTRLAAEVGVPVQRVRSPEEALLDEALLDDGCVTEIDGIRQVGRTYTITPGSAGEPTPMRSLSSPLEGVRVLDLGLAVAGPFGTQLLSDLGADVIKVNNRVFDGFWMRNHIAMCCNRGKRSITIDLKQPEGLAILHELVQTADVVHHNMRYDAALRLGVDYESLKQVNASIVYCHTRGHDRSRESLPGNDQTAAALAGISWLEGGVDSGATPLWPATSLGDTGNGFLSAIAVVQALRHRDQTGEGAFVDTSILCAHLLNASMTWVSADGSNRSERPTLDFMQTGWSPRYRLYETSDGWLCVAAVTEAHLAALLGVLELGELTDGVEQIFMTRTAQQWFAALDGAGVPCEIADASYVRSLFDDQDLIDKGWVTSYVQPRVGRMDVQGLLVDLSDTPGRVAGPPIVPGQHTRAIMSELGYDEEQVDKLVASGVLFVAEQRELS